MTELQWEDGQPQCDECAYWLNLYRQTPSPTSLSQEVEHQILEEWHLNGHPDLNVEGGESSQQQH